MEEQIIKLLLVEDDANLCYIIQGGLEDMIGGYKVLTASNGGVEGRASGRHRGRHRDAGDGRV